MKTKFVLFALLLQTGPLCAANPPTLSNWTGASGGDWSNDANWDPAVAPVATGSIAQLSDGGAAGAITINYDAAAATVGTITFDRTTAYTIAPTGGTLNFAVSSGSASITVTIVNGAGAHIIACPVSLSSPLTITQGSTSDFTISGLISGTQALTKAGTGVLVLSDATNSYSGGTAIHAGTISVTADGNLGASTGTVSISSGTLKFSETFSTSASRSFSLSSGASIDVAATKTGTIAGVISGAGSLSKVDTGTLVLSGTNTYTGGTVVSAGTLSIASDSNLGGSSGTLSIASATLITTAGITSSRSGSFTATAVFDTNAVSSTLSGNFGGGGSLTVQGGGSLALTGSNSYSGGTTVTAASTLSGTTGGIQGAVSIAAGTFLTFNQSSTGTYSGAISGAGTVTKSGSGNVTFSGTSSSFTGPTNVTAGTLTVNGSLANTSLLTVSSGATLSGSGTVGPTTNNGTIDPGNGSATGSLNISGALTSGASSGVNISIAPLSSDQLLVSAAAALDGTLTIEPTSGFYGFNASYTILTSSAISGTFATVTSTNSAFAPTVVYSPTAVSLSVSISRPFALFTFENRNEKAVGDNIDDLHAAGQLSSDLLNVFNTMVGQSFHSINEALDQMHPAPYSAFTEMQAESGSQITSLFHRLPYLACSCYNPNRFWVDLFGNSLTMKSHGMQFGFQGNSGGVAAGYDGEISENLILGFGGAWNRSHLRWHHDHGHGDVDGFFGAVYLDYLANQFYIGANVLAGMDFYETSRHLQFFTTNRHAKATPKALDIMAQLSTAYLFGSPQAFFYPYANFDFLYLRTHNFHENGANGLNLNVRTHTASTFRTEMGLGLQVKDVNVDETMCISPKVSIGWVNMCPVERQNYVATFQGADIPFTTYGWDKSWNLLNLDFGLTISYYCYTLTFKYNVETSPDSGTTLFNQNGAIHFDWKW
ncbi:MAG: hypothetical protein COT85_04220 [Chlamydiae bacterium CG10_big_fil_rev_8_21_14_0_10_42_34]|nr:MAG: hypothetical protein COT85_04220 [Chlamydiae bacterium CG10_big_fil_rev_8_21_14_0_10_42_34]